MEVTIYKSASEIAGDTLNTFKQIRRNRKIEKAEAERQTNLMRAKMMALIIAGLLVTYLIQRIFFKT